MNGEEWCLVAAPGSPAKIALMIAIRRCAWRVRTLWRVTSRGPRIASLCSSNGWTKEWPRKPVLTIVIEAPGEGMRNADGQPART
jgi:hypothetical protein